MTVAKIVALAAGMALTHYLFGAFCAASFNLAEWPQAGRGWTAAAWLVFTFGLICWLRREGDL
jgi:apolipoprotein N-acyltransferase